MHYRWFHFYNIMLDIMAVYFKVLVRCTDDGQALTSIINHAMKFSSRYLVVVRDEG